MTLRRRFLLMLMVVFGLSLVGSPALGEELERDGLPDLLVVRTIDFAHASTSEQSDDAVAARDQFSRLETLR